MELIEIIEDLENEFNNMLCIFPMRDWKFYKFGRGGPYYEKLISLTEKTVNHDKRIMNFFQLEKDTASFGKLIVLCMRNDSPKEMYKANETMRRQLIHMKEKLNG